jgi:hypothetical protein
MTLYKKKLKVSLEQVWQTAVVVQVMASATYFAIDSIPKEMFTTGPAWKWDGSHEFWQVFSHTQNWFRLRAVKLDAAATKGLMPANRHNQFIRTNKPAVSMPNFSPLLLPKPRIAEEHDDPDATNPTRQPVNSSAKCTPTRPPS